MLGLSSVEEEESKSDIVNWSNQMIIIERVVLLNFKLLA